MTDLLFVYGSLRRGCDNIWARQLAEAGIWLGAAHVRGSLYEIDDYPGLVLAEADCLIRGDLLHLRDPAATFAWLDDYEETGPAFPEPWEYRRVVTPVYQSDHGERLAWIYVFDRPVEGLQLVAGGDWLKV